MSIWGRRSSHSGMLDALKDKIKPGSTDDGLGCDYHRGRWHSGHIESLPLLALRQMKADVGADNVMYIHTTLLPLSQGSR